MTDNNANQKASRGERLTELKDKTGEALEELKEKGQEFLGRHEEQIESVIEKVAGFVDDQTKRKYHDKIETVTEKAKEAVEKLAGTPETAAGDIAPSTEAEEPGATPTAPSSTAASTPSTTAPSTPGSTAASTPSTPLTTPTSAPTPTPPPPATLTGTPGAGMPSGAGPAEEPPATATPIEDDRPGTL